MLGWHFTNGLFLRDGQPLVEGRTYRVDWPLVMCTRGLHACRRALDALPYAPGSVISRVELSGEILHQQENGHEKSCASKRRVLWYADASDVLYDFACTMATDALSLVDACGEVVDPRSWRAIQTRQAWLNGDASTEELRAAYTAARAAASRTAYVTGTKRAVAKAAATAAAYTAEFRHHAVFHDYTADAVWVAARVAQHATLAILWANSRATYDLIESAQNMVLTTMLESLRKESR